MFLLLFFMFINNLKNLFKSSISLLITKNLKLFRNVQDFNNTNLLQADFMQFVKWYSTNRHT